MDTSKTSPRPWEVVLGCDIRGDDMPDKKHISTKPKKGKGTYVIFDADVDDAALIVRAVNEYERLRKMKAFVFEFVDFYEKHHGPDDHDGYDGLYDTAYSLLKETE